jgi:hypothetical protein
MIIFKVVLARFPSHIPGCSGLETYLFLYITLVRWYFKNITGFVIKTDLTSHQKIKLATISSVYGKPKWHIRAARAHSSPYGKCLTSSFDTNFLFK